MLCDVCIINVDHISIVMYSGSPPLSHTTTRWSHDSHLPQKSVNNTYPAFHSFVWKSANIILKCLWVHHQLRLSVSMSLCVNRCVRLHAAPTAVCRQLTWSSQWRSLLQVSQLQLAVSTAWSRTHLIRSKTWHAFEFFFISYKKTIVIQQEITHFLGWKGS